MFSSNSPQNKPRLVRKRRFTGWRKSALINTTFLTVATILLFSFLGAAIIRSGNRLDSTFLFFEGDCGTSNAIDLGLHLLLNTFSTAVLASSNFFMQVLNAPSREETEAAHTKGSFLDIGVASWRNAFSGKIAWPKTVGWLLLMISSIPIHLIFNSVVFSTDYRDTKFHLSIATEGFVNGDAYYIPGASLAKGGLGNLLDCRDRDNHHGDCAEEGYGDGVGHTQIPVARNYPDDNFIMDFSPYNNTYYTKNITHAAASGKEWVKLEKEDCINEYLTTNCRGLTKYGNLVVVVDRKASSWAREELWDLNSTVAKIWDSMVPADQDNSLWYAAECEASTAAKETDDPYCFNTCYKALGAGPQHRDFLDGSADQWTIKFFPDDNKISRTYGTNLSWARTEYPWLWSSSRNVSEFGLHPGMDELPVKYCLTEPLSRQCNVGLSNLLLLTVAVCVLVKGITCIAVVIVMREKDPLVTLGDAIQSFISKPDSTTVGESYVQPDFKPRRSDRSQGDRGKYSEVVSHTVPIQWRNKWQKGLSFIPWHSWVSFVFIMVIGYASFAILKNVELGSGIMTSNAFRNLFTQLNHDSDTANTNVQQKALTVILIANTPQIIISLWYLVYNQLLTRLVMAREWARFSSGKPQPLRVTYPRGRQVSTYFLSLPLRYSIPLLITSVITHWLVSRTVYVFVSAGAYYTEAIGDYPYHKDYDPNLPPGAVMQLRYSMTAHILVLLICTVMAIVLIGLSMRSISSSRTHGDTMAMPPVGTNSRAIAAACRVSRLSTAEGGVDEYLVADASHTQAQSSQVEDEETARPGANKSRLTFQVNEGLGRKETFLKSRKWTFGARKNTGIHVWAEDEDLDESAEAGLDPEKVRLAKISRSLLRWGIVEMPEEWYRSNGLETSSDRSNEAADDGTDNVDPAAQEAQVAHISFGTPLDRVVAPEEATLLLVTLRCSVLRSWSSLNPKEKRYHRLLGSLVSVLFAMIAYVQSQLDPSVNSGR